MDVILQTETSSIVIFYHQHIPNGRLVLELQGHHRGHYTRMYTHEYKRGFLISSSAKGSLISSSGKGSR